MKLNEKLNIELLGEGRAAIPFSGEPGWSIVAPHDCHGV